MEFLAKVSVFIAKHTKKIIAWFAGVAALLVAIAAYMTDIIETLSK